jgi:hypothetical protein
MARKPRDHVQTGLRIREELRLRLERSAQANRIPLNTEMALRLERSFAADTVRTLDEITSDLKKVSNRLKTLEAAE